MTAPAGPILAIDTATTEAVVAIAAPDGALIASDAWVAGYRHGEELLARIDALLSSADVSVRSLGGVAVGIGPGAFTGLRVGIATAKGLAVGLVVPLVGVPSASVIAAAALDEDPTIAGRPLAVLLPAGPSERTLVVGGEAVRLRSDEEPALPDGAVLVAFDLPGRAPEDALRRGAAAQRGFAAALARLGVERLARTGGDDVAGLIPEYVTPPRGVPAAHGEVAWSRTRG